MPQMGEERAYMVGVRKDRSPHHSGHSIASAEYASRPNRELPNPGRAAVEPQSASRLVWLAQRPGSFAIGERSASYDTHHWQNPTETKCAGWPRDLGRPAASMARARVNLWIPLTF